MPVLFRELDVESVKAVLYARGYGPSSGSGQGLSFNKPTGKVFSSGSAERKPLPEIPPKTVQQILRYSETVEDAANQMERVMLGQGIMAPTGDNVNAKVAEPGLTLAEVEQLISARVASEVAKQVAQHTAQVSGWLAEVRKEIVSLRGDVTRLQASAPKKPGRPLGSRNKPRPDAEEPDAPMQVPGMPAVDEEGPKGHF